MSMRPWGFVVQEMQWIEETPRVARDQNAAPPSAGYPDCESDRALYPADLIGWGRQRRTQSDSGHLAEHHTDIGQSAIGHPD